MIERIQPDEIFAFMVGVLKSGASADEVRGECEAAIRFMDGVVNGFMGRLELEMEKAEG